MTDAPNEIENHPPNIPLSRSLGRVFDNAELVAIRPEKALIATWTGGTGFNVYDPSGWFDGGDDPFHSANGESGEVYHFNMTDPSRLDDPEAHAREILEDYGFTIFV